MQNGSQALSAISYLLLGYLVLYLITSLITAPAMWQIFKKAGKPAWAALIPFYNLFVLFKITWGTGFLFLLYAIPYVGFVIWILTFIKLSEAFGKDNGFSCGLIFLNFIFVYILAFDKESVYYGVPVKCTPVQYYAPNGYQKNAYSAHPTGVRFCSACGAPIATDTRFCPKCGRVID